MTRCLLPKFFERLELVFWPQHFYARQRRERQRRGMAHTTIIATGCYTITGTGRIDRDTPHYPRIT